jgi:dipeptidyl aminopeptidase/acylaminoacyl peptidase
MRFGLAKLTGIRRGGVWIACALCAGSTPAIPDQHSGAVSENGNIVLVSGSVRKTLTATGRDGHPALTPDRQWVVFTRSAAPPPDPSDDALIDCASLSSADELRQVKIDGSDDQLLLRGRGGAEPSQALCGFHNKQFSSDGNTIYFLSPAWATSSGLHIYSRDSQTARFVMPSNDYVVLSWCTSDLRDAIIAQQHRYFKFGGSFDWYWLFDPSGKTELGPVGEFDSVEAIKSDLDASGQCQG